MATAIFFASTTGNSEEIANKISTALDGVKVFDLAGTKIEEMNNYNKLILGGSTWGDGELNDDWEDAWIDFCKLDLSNKTIALFGLGDQESYSYEFCSAMGIIYEQIVKSKAKIVGFTPIKGYFHDESKAQINDKFIGFAIDEDNQDDLTDERISNWTNEIRKDIL